MTLERLLGSAFDCACGRRHESPTRRVLYGSGVAGRLDGLLAETIPAARRLVLLADRRTLDACGEACRRALVDAGREVSLLLLADGPRSGPVCDDTTRDELAARLPAGTDALLAVGSGVVNDLAKWLATDLRLPYAVVATAASMNGYTSSNIAPAVRGVKRVLMGAAPLAVAADPAVIRDAPFDLTAAGLGDVLARPVSATDWRLNHLLFEEYYCPFLAGLIREVEPGYWDAPDRLRARDPAALEALFMGLLYSGLSMTLAGTSFPASGGEHMTSHVLDMLALAHDGAHDLHGRQVGVGVIFAAALYERVLALESPEFRLVTEPTDAAFWGALAPVVEEEHVLKRARAERAVSRLRRPGAWDAIRADLAPMTRPAARLKQCLRDAGAAHRLADIGCTRAAFLEAVRHAHQMRERYTILDLARAVGVLPGAAEDIVDHYLEA
jgi:glycerol-1-phosphate dehydrogenase [NAD(P)+]